MLEYVYYQYNLYSMQNFEEFNLFNPLLKYDYYISLIRILVFVAVLFE